MIEISVVTSITVIAVSLALLVLAGVLGYESLRLVGLTRPAGTTLLTATIPMISVIFGTTLVSVVLFLASLAGALTRTTISALVLAQVALAILRRDFFNMILEVARNLWQRALVSRWMNRVIDLIVLVVFLWFVAVGFLRTTLPASDADSATAYLNAANLFLHYGKLIDVGHFVGNMGKTGFLLLVYGMGAYSAMVAHALLFVLSTIGMMVMYLLIRHYASAVAASLTMIAVITSSYTIEEIILPAKFDGAAFAWSTTSLVLLAMVIEGERRQWVFVALGTLAGFLAGMSYNNTVAAGLAPLALLPILLYQRETRWPKLLLIAFISTFAASAPTYIQNALLFGNPVFPFAGNLFRSGLGSTIPADGFAYQYIKEISEAYAARDIVELITLPFSLFLHDPTPIQALRDPWLGAVLLISLIGGIVLGVMWVIDRVTGRSNAVLQELLVLAIIGTYLTYLFWALTQHILRYFSAGLAFAVLLCGLVLQQVWLIVERLGKYSLRLLAIGAALIAIFIMVRAWPIGHQYSHATEWILHGATESQYISATFVYNIPHGFGPALEQMRAVLRDEDKVLSFIAGNYYFGNNVITFSGNGSNTLSSPHGMTKPLSRFIDWQEWETDIKSQQFNYLVINPGYLYLSERERPIVMGYLANRRPAIIINSNLVFRIQ